MSIQGLSDGTREILDRCVFGGRGLSDGCLRYDQLGRELHEKKIAVNTLIKAREGLVIAEIVTAVFSIAIAPTMLLNRRVKTSMAVSLATVGIPALFVTAGIFYERIYLLPNHKKKQAELKDFSEHLQISKKEMEEMKTAADELSKFVQTQQGKIDSEELLKLDFALKEVQELEKLLTPPS